jgi:hypothetical protein
MMLHRGEPSRQVSKRTLSVRLGTGAVPLPSLARSLSLDEEDEVRLPKLPRISGSARSPERQGTFSPTTRVRRHRSHAVGCGDGDDRLLWLCTTAMSSGCAYGRTTRPLLIGAAALLRDDLTGVHPELRAVARKARLAPV